MGNISADISAQLYMLRDVYRNLRGKNPKHDLLKLATLDADEGAFDFAPAYYIKFVKTSDPSTVHGYYRYTQELKTALRQESQLETTANNG